MPRRSTNPLTHCYPEEIFECMKFGHRDAVWKAAGDVRRHAINALPYKEGAKLEPQSRPKPCMDAPIRRYSGRGQGRIGTRPLNVLITGTLLLSGHWPRRYAGRVGVSALKRLTLQGKEQAGRQAESRVSSSKPTNTQLCKSRLGAKKRERPRA